MTGIGPGTVLAGRYRLDDLLDESDGAWIWRATDLVLVRDVSIRIVGGTDPRAQALLDAARTAATITGMHVLRILDADTHPSGDGSGIAYVVTEWSNGDSLAKRLTDDVLQPRLAAQIVRDVAATLADAHVQGVAHGRLLPETIHLADGKVKIAGFVVDAVIHGRSGDRISDHESDIRNVAGLLYAALTGKWPGTAGSVVPPAPLEHGQVLHARQVRAGVPTQLDRICDTVLNGPAAPGVPEIETAHEIRSALSDFLGDTIAAMPLARQESYPDPFGDPEATQFGMPAVGSGAPELVPAAATGGEGVPAPAPYVPARYGMGSTTDADRAIPDIFAPTPPVPPQSVEEYDEEDWEYWDEGSHWGRWVAAALVVVVIAAAGVFVWKALGGSAGGGSTATPPPASQTPEPAEPVTPAGVTAYDPYGDNKENDKQAKNAFDGKPDTTWNTERYRKGPDITQIKPGVGLLVDLGASRQVRGVDLTLGGGPYTVSFFVADGDEAPANVDGLTALGDPIAGATGTASVNVDEGITGRWVVVWLTAIPQTPKGYVGTIAELTVNATPSAVSESTDGADTGATDTGDAGSGDETDSGE